MAGDEAKFEENEDEPLSVQINNGDESYEEASQEPLVKLVKYICRGKFGNYIVDIDSRADEPFEYCCTILDSSNGDSGSSSDCNDYNQSSILSTRSDDDETQVPTSSLPSQTKCLKKSAKRSKKMKKSKKSKKSKHNKTKYHLGFPFTEGPVCGFLESAALPPSHSFANTDCLMEHNEVAVAANQEYMEPRDEIIYIKEELYEDNFDLNAVSGSAFESSSKSNEDSDLELVPDRDPMELTEEELAHAEDALAAENLAKQIGF